MASPERPFEELDLSPDLLELAALRDLQAEQIGQLARYGILEKAIGVAVQKGLVETGDDVKAACLYAVTVGGENPRRTGGGICLTALDRISDPDSLNLQKRHVLLFYERSENDYLAPCEPFLEEEAELAAGMLSVTDMLAIQGLIPRLRADMTEPAMP